MWSRNTPVALASKLSALQVENIGAAGTFIVRARLSEAKVRTTFERACPHDADVIVCAVSSIERLLQTTRLEDGDGRVFVAVLASQPRAAPDLPFERGKPWMVRVESLNGTFVVGRKRPMRRKWLDANAIVEREFGVRATTRVWETMERIAKAASRDPRVHPSQNGR
jgi:hypothetical protein